MAGNPWLLMLLIFAAGGATGWLLKPDTSVVVQPSIKVAVRHPPTRPVRDTSAQALMARQWMDRIETSEVREVAQEIPAGDFEPLIESLMTSVWGGISAKQMEQFMVLIGKWSEQDPDGALAWARALENPRQREVGLIGIAMTVAKDDPKAAFEIYSEVEEITTNAGRYLSGMMRTLYNDAAKQGVDAVLDLARRTPKNGTNGSEGIAIDFPPDFDFRNLVDGLIETTDLGGSSELYKPFAPSDPFGSWAVQDADAAFAYIVDGTSQGQFLRWSGMPYKLGEKWGTLEADRWMGMKLAELSTREQRALLSKSDLAHSPGILRKYIANMPTEESAADFRFQFMDYTKKNLHLSLEVLNDVPEVRARVEAIERLRGVTDDRALRNYLSKLNLVADRIDEIVETVKQPAEPEE